MPPTGVRGINIFPVGEWYVSAEDTRATLGGRCTVFVPSSLDLSLQKSPIWKSRIHKILTK